MKLKEAKRCLNEMTPVWWFYKRPRLVILASVHASGHKKTSDYAFFKVMWRGHKIEIEDAPVKELHRTREECEKANKKHED